LWWCKHRDWRDADPEEHDYGQTAEPQTSKGRQQPLERTGFEPSVPRRERNESPLGTGTVTEATKVRLEAVAYLPRIEGSTNVPDGRGGSAAKKDQI